MVSKKNFVFLLVFVFQGCLFAKTPAEDFKEVYDSIQKLVAAGCNKASTSTPAFLLTNAAVLALIALEHQLIQEKKVAYSTAFCLALFDGKVLLLDPLKAMHKKQKELAQLQIVALVEEQKRAQQAEILLAKAEEQAKLDAEIEASPEVFELQKRFFEGERSLVDQQLFESSLLVEKNKAKQRIQREQRLIEKEKIELEATRKMAEISVARVAAEADRAAAEGARARAEGNRVGFEWLRAIVEIMILLKR